MNKTASTLNTSVGPLSKSKHAGHIRCARGIAKSLGIRIAAGYLRNRNWSLEGALYVLGCLK